LKSVHPIQAGFSLIELLIVITVVAIITSIAAPGWRAHVLASHRTEAVAMLMHIATRQEQFRIQQHRYAATKELTTAPPAGLGIFNTGKHYILTAAANDHEFTALAIVNAKSTQADDKICWLFGVDETGRRWSESSTGKISTTQCWRG
jgi:type IV pilus assembly protein PilE